MCALAPSSGCRRAVDKAREEYWRGVGVGWGGGGEAVIAHTDDGQLGMDRVLYWSKRATPSARNKAAKC